MIKKLTLSTTLTVLLLFSTAGAQTSEMTISLNEAFFDALLESVFQNYDPIEFPIAQHASGTDHFGSRLFQMASFQDGRHIAPNACESIRIIREMNGVRTAVRFRDGKVFLPLAFSGSYAPPFVGCVDFAGIAEANIDIEFDQAARALIGRIRVLNVNLNGTGGVGGTVVAKMVQSSIDKKFNPIEIVSLEKMSFLVPIRNAGNLRMKAVSATPAVGAGSVTVRVTYAFEKG